MKCTVCGYETRGTRENPLPICRRCGWDPRKLIPKTNLAPAKPFLVNKKTGLPLHQKLQINDHNYYYHATNYNNLSGIQRSGMDPGRGGKGGAGQRVKSDHFVNTSKNFVHATSCTKTAGSYGLLHDEPALFVKAYGSELFRRGIPPNPGKLGEFTVIIRFAKIIPNVTWEKDIYDPRDAYRTRNKIPLQYIEALTTEGWVKVGKLTELNEALKTL